MDQALDKHIAKLEGTAAPADHSKSLQALTQGEAAPGPEDTGKGLLALSTHRPPLHKPYNMVGRLGPSFLTLAFATCRLLISPHSGKSAHLEYAIAHTKLVAAFALLAALRRYHQRYPWLQKREPSLLAYLAFFLIRTSSLRLDVSASELEARSLLRFLPLTYLLHLLRPAGTNLNF